MANVADRRRRDADVRASSTIVAAEARPTVNQDSPGGLARSGVQDPATRAQRGPCGDRVLSVGGADGTWVTLRYADMGDSDVSVQLMG